MDSKAITAAANELAKAERKFGKVHQRKEVAIAKAIAKVELLQDKKIEAVKARRQPAVLKAVEKIEAAQNEKIEAAQNIVIAAKNVLSSLVASA